MTRKVFTAAVARIEQPGTKFDYVMTLVGPEGIGKSTIIRNMGRQWYSDSLITIEGKEGMEAVQGKWLIEIGELTSYKKSTAEMYKAFLSKQEDVFRPAFARSVEIYPRQCVFFATTNEDYFLKGDTGNRRWWCVTVGVNTPTKDVWAMTDETIGQIWAEAKHRYAQGEKLYLDERLEVAARKRQAENNEVEGDERKGMIQAFLMKPVPAAWPTMPPEARRQYILSADLLTPEGTEMREYVCATEILVECFGENAATLNGELLILGICGRRGNGEHCLAHTGQGKHSAMTGHMVKADTAVLTYNAEGLNVGGIGAHVGYNGSLGHKRIQIVVSVTGADMFFSHYSYLP
jgi:hypothetical protein